MSQEGNKTPIKILKRKKTKKSSTVQVTAGMYLKDPEKEFSVLVDRSVGGSSLSEGEAEIMLHR